MPWYEVPAYFFGGAFFANFVLHLVAGVSGRRFPTPFASPPFRGLSPPPVNVLYGLLNLAVAYALLAGVGSYELQRASHAGLSAAGFGLWSLASSWRVGKLLQGF
jgi:hypothetical protein